jgi:DNA-binding response OmpR family regulator
MRILLAEDDPTLRTGLQQVLAAAGHSTVTAADGSHADTLLATESFDLVVLDLGLPKLDGLDVLARLRRRRQTVPVLILSARDRMEDRVRGLDGGADDYLSKPFDLPEFEARVRAMLRRGQSAGVQIGLLEWDREARQGHIGPSTIALSRHETVMLESLLKSPGRIVAKEELARRLGAGDVVAADNKVEVYIHRLRRKLLEAKVEIHTVRGLGYLLRAIERDTI